MTSLCSCYIGTHVNVLSLRSHWTRLLEKRRRGQEKGREGQEKYKREQKRRGKRRAEEEKQSEEK
jgi:hypothetical protein